MTIATTAQTTFLSRLPALLDPLLHRFALQQRAKSSPHATRDSAAALYARAARYEATQPGFAADLRTAAEAMERANATQRR